MFNFNNLAINSKNALIVILGATGTGKTKLAVELCNKYDGDIINADSMQIYSGLNIVTNQPSDLELSSCKHHLLAVANPHNELFSVHDFQKLAIPIIGEIHARGRIPIIVGGTNYYIESLLWKFTLAEQEDVTKSEQQDVTTSEQQDVTTSEQQDVRKTIAPQCMTSLDHRNQSQDDGFDELPECIEGTNDMYKSLWIIDNAMAKKIHPLDSRKIQRALSVYTTNGKTLTQMLNKQEIGTKTGALRYLNPLILLVQCDTDVLDQRLNSRVNSMVKRGLIKELKDFHHQFNKDRVKKSLKPDYTRGIFQTIGFKEFHEYLISKSPTSEQLENGITQMKLATRQYTRRQTRWITNRFIKRNDKENPPVYGLDSTLTSSWDINVKQKAFKIVQQYLNGEEIEEKPIENKKHINLKVFNTCTACGNRVFVTEYDWLS